MLNLFQHPVWGPLRSSEGGSGFGAAPHWSLKEVTGEAGGGNWCQAPISKCLRLFGGQGYASAASRLSIRRCQIRPAAVTIVSGPRVHHQNSLGSPARQAA